jgi:hypothetical protein
MIRTSQPRKEKATMLNRREMIQTAMVFSAWPAIRPLATTQQITGSGAPDDKVFSASVRWQFELAPKSVNLLSVGPGDFTKANRENARPRKWFVHAGNRKWPGIIFNLGGLVQQIRCEGW